MSPYPHERLKPRLTDRQRWELAGASLHNAVDLRDDADVLRKAGRLQRSGFLLWACLEEVLKAHLCLTRDPRDDQEWNRFWKTFRDHPLKLKLLKEIEPESPRRHDEGIRILRTFRERSLYVEVSDDGNPWTPMGLFDLGELRPESIDLWYNAVNALLLQEIKRLNDSEERMKGRGKNP
jgi:AbiV family abortive infection protein